MVFVLQNMLAAFRTMKRILFLAIVCLSLICCQEENKAPSCKITDPQNNAVFRIGDVFEIAVGASDSDGEISEVSITINNIGVAKLHSPPYKFDVSTDVFGSGTYSIRAVAVDDGNLKDSDEIEVRVDELELPRVATMSVSSISSVSVEVFGHIQSDGGSEITERGICWNRVGNPTLLDNYVASGDGTGHFKAAISGLDCNTTYYFRAYGTNEVGTAYGDSRDFTTANLPAISTMPPLELTTASAQCGGTITDICGTLIHAKGVCWSTSHNPTIDDLKTDEGGGPESFTSVLSDLTVGVLYFIRAYATVSEGTVYGEEVSIRTWDNSPITDIDGNEYNTVLIGDQIWMAENLGVTRYADGKSIPLVEDRAEWDALDRTSSAYCWYDNDSASYALTYGALYTYFAASNAGAVTGFEQYIQGVCPEGWHLPDNDEWDTLANFLGGVEIAGGKLKEEGTVHWLTPNTGATNESGFTALPGGYRDDDGRFYNLGLAGYWRTTKYHGDYQAYVRWLYYDYNEIRRLLPRNENGYSVRCVKDS